MAPWGGNTRFYSKLNQIKTMLYTSLIKTCLPPFRKQKRLTCPNVPRAFCCPFPTLQCPKCPSCQRSSESQTVPATADLHSYTVSRKHAVIIFIFSLLPVWACCISLAISLEICAWMYFFFLSIIFSTFAFYCTCF